MPDSLRTDERQWLIYDDESLGAVMRGLEAYALSTTGQRLARHPDIAVRAIGHFMIRVGEARGLEMLRNDGAQAVAARHITELGAYLADRPAVDPVSRAAALSELHSAVFRLDSRAASAGLTGGGVHRIAVRGD